MASRKIRSMRGSRGLIDIWHSQGRHGNGTPRGRETRNVTIDLQRQFHFRPTSLRSERRILATH